MSGMEVASYLFFMLGSVCLFVASALALLKP